MTCTSKQHNLLVSVIIPAYNADKYLGHCLDSLLSQTYSNIEIICVDDASTDETPLLISSYSKKDDRVRFFTHESNRNAGGARNTAIEHAFGDYLFFLDSDDWLCRDAIEVLVDATEDGSYDIVSSPLTDFDQNGESRIEEHMLPSIDKSLIIEYLMKNGLRLCGGVYRRSLFTDNAIKYPENVFFEDNAIGQIPFCLAERIKVIGNSVYCYKAFGESSSRSYNRQHIRDRITTTRMVIDNAIYYGYYEQYKSLVDYRFLDLSSYTIELVSNLPFFEARKIMKEQKKTIEILLPNSHINLLSALDQKKLNNPLRYLYCKKNHDIIQQVCKILHRVRHVIVVVIKQAIGIDPKKSFI